LTIHWNQIHQTQYTVVCSYADTFLSDLGVTYTSHNTQNSLEWKWLY